MRFANHHGMKNMNEITMFGLDTEESDLPNEKKKKKRKKENKIQKDHGCNTNDIIVSGATKENERQTKSASHIYDIQKLHRDSAIFTKTRNKHCEQISAIIGLKQMKRKHWPTEGGQWVLLLVFLPNVYPTQWHTIESGFSFLPINE